MTCIYYHNNARWEVEIETDRQEAVADQLVSLLQKVLGQWAKENLWHETQSYPLTYIHTYTHVYPHTYVLHTNTQKGLCFINNIIIQIPQLILSTFSVTLMNRATNVSVIILSCSSFILKENHNHLPPAVFCLTFFAYHLTIVLIHHDKTENCPEAVLEQHRTHRLLLSIAWRPR